MTGGMYEKIPGGSERGSMYRERKEALLILAAAGVLALAVTAADSRSSRIGPQGTIVRNTYGKGERIEELVIAVEGEKEKAPVNVTVEDRKYPAAEVQSILQQAVERLDMKILGKNQSLDHVDSELELVSSIPELSVSVAWELSRYDVMRTDGTLIEERLDPDGTLVTVKGLLRCQDQEALYERTAAVYPKRTTGTAAAAQEAGRLLRKEEETTREDAYIKLPGTIGGKNVVWYHAGQNRGPLILLLGSILAVCPLLWKRQKEGELQQKRERQMLSDYPEIVSQFTLLTGAGMTVKSAWHQILKSYMRKKNKTGTRYAYEEMAAAWNEMKSGIPEAECYEHFGVRCGLQLYLKFGSLLAQNLKKGSKGLQEILRGEAASAFEERKREARKKGEEAGTKLLVPMFLMLGIVLVMVIVPAFLSMQV